MPNTTSTTAIVIDSRTLAERWKQHAAAVMQSGSTYVLAIGGALVSYLLDRWAVMTTDQQAGLVGSLGVTNPGTLSMLLTLITLAVRFKPAPRGTVSPAMMEALQRIVDEQTNARLIAAGRPPLALPASKLLAVTHDQLAAAQAQAQSGPLHPDDDDAYPEVSPGYTAPSLTPVAPAPVAPPPAFVDTQPAPLSHDAIVRAQLAARREGVMAAAREFDPNLTDDQIRALIGPTAPTP